MRQGEIYWLHCGGIEGSEPAGRRPALVVQHDRFNRSAIATVVVAAITSNRRLADMPGNVRLRREEAALNQTCVVNVTQLRTVDRARLTERIGVLGEARMLQVLCGLALVLGTEGLPESE